MNYIQFLEKEHIINSIQTDRDRIIFSFENTNKKLEIVSQSDCCDLNWFENLEEINILLGCKIIAIDEGRSIDEPSVTGLVLIKFPIKIKYEKNILKELRQKNINWNRLPKDIFNLLYSSVTKQNNIDIIDTKDTYIQEFEFIRKNESNGYYSGHLDINLIDRDK